MDADVIAAFLTNDNQGLQDDFNIASAGQIFVKRLVIDDEFASATGEQTNPCACGFTPTNSFIILCRRHLLLLSLRVPKLLAFAGHGDGLRQYRASFCSASDDQLGLWAASL